MTGLLLKLAEDGGPARGPELAKAELVVRLQEKNIEMCAFASSSLLVLEYVQKFGHKLCCYDDLRVIIGKEYLFRLTSLESCTCSMLMISQMTNQENLM